MGEKLLAFVLPLIFVVLFVVGGYLLERAACDAKWKEFPSTYGMLSGCMIYVNNRWIPEDNYRVL